MTGDCFNIFFHSDVAIYHNCSKICKLHLLSSFTTVLVHSLLSDIYILVLHYIASTPLLSGAAEGPASKKTLGW